MGSHVPESYIVDVGCASNAMRTMGLRDLFGIPVLFIDPDSAALEQIDAAPRDIKVAAAITSFDGEALFHYYQDGTHSLLETNKVEIHKYIDGHTGQPAKIEDWTARKSEYVQCFTLRTLICRFGITSIEFLKIDAQGHDLEVVKSLGEYISIVRHIEVEVQLTDFEVYMGASKLSEIMEFALGSGFELIHSEYQTHGQEQNLIFRNLNSPTHPPGRVSTEVLLRVLSETSPKSSWEGQGSTFFQLLRKVARRLGLNSFRSSG